MMMGGGPLRPRISVATDIQCVDLETLDPKIFETISSIFYELVMSQ